MLYHGNLQQWKWPLYSQVLQMLRKVHEMQANRNILVPGDIAECCAVSKIALNRTKLFLIWNTQAHHWLTPKFTIQLFNSIHFIFTFLVSPIQATCQASHNLCDFTHTITVLMAFITIVKHPILAKLRCSLRSTNAMVDGSIRFNSHTAKCMFV